MTRHYGDGMTDGPPIVTPGTVLAAMREGDDVRPTYAPLSPTLVECLRMHRVSPSQDTKVQAAVLDWLRTFTVHLGSAASALDVVQYLGRMVEADR